MTTIDEKIKLLGLPDLCNIHDDVMVRNYDFDFDKLLYEKLHTRFCKITLNVSKYSSNYACRAELGRYPLCYKMWNLSIQYWLRLENGTNNIILNNAYNCVKQENHDWIQSIQYLLSLNGLGNIWLQPPSCNNSIIKSYGRLLSKHAEEQYIQKWDKKCLLSKTAHLLSNLHKTYTCANYLLTMTDSKLREHFTKFRIGMSKLNYYIGLRLDTSTVCDMCDLGEDGTVEHFLLYCNKYSNIRQSFIENLKKVNVYLNHMDDNSKLYFILNIENQALLICNYVSQLLKERNL